MTASEWKKVPGGFACWYRMCDFCVCRTSTQERQKLSFSRSVDSESVTYLPPIVDELKSEDYVLEVLPFFQRIAVSGEEMSGVSAVVFCLLVYSQSQFCNFSLDTDKWQETVVCL